MEAKKNKIEMRRKIRMTAQRAFFILHFSFFIFFIACDVKDPIYDTAHPEKAQITVTTDWSGMGTGIIKPAEYYASYGTDELKATQDEYTFPNLFAPGSYTVYFYNKSAGIAINGHTATTDYSSPIGWLFTGRLQETVEADKDYAFIVPMRQQVRELTLIIEPTGGTTDRIENITASLSGVAGSLDLDNDAHGTPANVVLTFTKQTTGDYAGKWTATVRLLGITGAEQKLTGTISFVDGTPANFPLESDLSGDLSAFNGDKKSPLVLSGGVETQTGAGFTATITGWKVIDDSINVN
jgi:Protein of unknown function (DUF1812).